MAFMVQVVSFGCGDKDAIDTVAKQRRQL